MKMRGFFVLAQIALAGKFSKKLHIEMNITDKVPACFWCWFCLSLPVFCFDPHPDPHAEINGNSWVPPGMRFQPFFSFDPHLHDLLHKISHSFGGLFLFLTSGVGVGSQRESCIVVAQHAASPGAFYA